MIKRVFTRRLRLSEALYSVCIVLFVQCWWACSPAERGVNFSIIDALEAQEGIRGKEAYLKSPFSLQVIGCIWWGTKMALFQIWASMSLVKWGGFGTTPSN
ncbi:hypothetical protein [Nitritalea halalkaliphila]|uniref:hypothetical protein n=1 Tax=Nitritalea halalkaliphila TaxID=590849 RepID=UPI00031B7746|nr:hypothetical protein [Nitritalea halalkaliphila]